MEFNHYYFINKPTPSLKKRQKLVNKLQHKYNWSAILLTLMLIIAMSLMILMQIGGK